MTKDVSVSEALTAEDRLRLHVHDPLTFGFVLDDAEQLVAEIDALRSNLKEQPVAWAEGNSFRQFVSPETNYRAVHLYKEDNAAPFIEGRRIPLYASPSSPVSRERPTHRHVKRGTEYVLIGYGRMQAERWVIPHELLSEPSHTADMAEVAIYRSVDDGSLWVRPREEFEDGRFVALSPEVGNE